MAAKLIVLLASVCAFSRGRDQQVSAQKVDLLMSAAPRILPHAQRRNSQVSSQSKTQELAISGFPPLNTNYQQVLDKIAEKVEIFPVKMPYIENTFEFLRKKGYKSEDLANNFESAYPIMHEDAVRIAQTYLNNVKSYPDNDMWSYDFRGFINRLIKKRAVFSDGFNKYLGLSKNSYGYYKNENLFNENHSEALKKWESIQPFPSIFPSSNAPFKFEDMLTHNEIRIASLMSFSSHTFFINDGGRETGAAYLVDKESNIQREGVMVGITGSKLDLYDVREFKETIEVPGKNDSSDLDKPFRDYYNGLECPEKTKKFLLEGTTWTFNACIFYQRTKMLIHNLMVEANSRAFAVSKKAYVHIVGFGLGAWEKDARQRGIFLRAAVNAISAIEGKLQNVGHVNFAYIGTQERPAEGLPKNINISYIDKNPNLKLQDENMLLIVTYAYQGNGYPGNDYWIKSAQKTSDSAAACSSQIGQTQNPFLNERMSADNLRVVTKEGEFITLNEYIIRNPEPARSGRRHYNQH